MIGLLCFFLFVAGLCPAQTGGKKRALIKPSDIRDAFRQNEAKLLLGLDSRRTFINRQDVNISGIRAGLDFNGLARVGGGIYFLLSPIYQQFELTDPVTNEDTVVSARLRFNYVSCFFEPTIVHSKRWEISLPLHLGVGDTYYEGAGFDEATPQTVVMTEISATGYYRILKWIGISGGVGYRKILRGNNRTGENFDSPVYMVGIKLFVGYIYNKIFHPEKLDDW